MIKKLWRYTKGYRVRAALATLFVMAEVVLEVYIPYVMKDIINVGIKGNAGVAYILGKGALMLGLALTSLACGALCARCAVVSSTGFAKNLRQGLFFKVQDFSFANTDKFSTASLITRLTTDVTNVQQAYMMGIRTLVRAPMMLICATFMAVKVGPQLSGVFAFAIPVLGITIGVLGVAAFPKFQRMLKKYDGMNARVQENLTAIRTVKAFVRSDYESERFCGASSDVRRAQVAAERLIVLNGPIAQLVLYSCMIATCWIGGGAIIAGTMQEGDLMSFISYIAQVLSSIMMIMMIFINLVLSKASATRITEVLDEKIDITDEKANKELKVSEGSIEFENVSFSYSRDPNNLTLKNINLSIKPGETVGIIGGTGSAKTSLVQLIPRLYDVYGGRVLVGGHDVREYTLDNLRDSVAMVLQKNVLFSGSIMDNLKWGDADASDEEIKRMCEAAQADGFITSFPNGYDTQLGQGGVNISGGQKQRLCIARALIKKPKVIILDDSTSAVDTATDAKIRDALRNRLKETTTIIIAQRIASVMDADKIVVLENGRIDAVGTHEELIETNEIYREVYTSQQKGDE